MVLKNNKLLSTKRIINAIYNITMKANGFSPNLSEGISIQFSLGVLKSILEQVHCPLRRVAMKKEQLVARLSRQSYL